MKIFFLVLVIAFSITNVHASYVRTEGDYSFQFHVDTYGICGEYIEGDYSLKIVPDDASITYLCGIAILDPPSVEQPNVAPVVEAGADTSINEGDTLSGSGSFTDSDSSTWTATVNYGDGSPSLAIFLNSDKSFSLSHTYANDGSYTITVTIIDDHEASGSDTAKVTVNNLAPVVDAGSDLTANEGETVTFSGSFTDPGSADTYTISWDFGDGTTALGTLTPTHVYSDNGTYTVTATVTDDDSGVGLDTAVVTVNNVAPTATFNVPTSVNEGSPISLSLTSPSDPSSADTAADFQYAFDCGSGYGSFSLSSSATCLTNDNGARTVKGKIMDKDYGVTEYSTSVSVNNGAPTVTITGPAAGSLYPIGSVTFIGTYSDSGTSDTHSAQWTFDTITTEQQSVSLGSVNTIYPFTAAGVYSVKLTVTDKDGEMGTATSVDGQDAYIVVYDPKAGFVTGGGWITSPPGAYIVDPSLTGRATFGFVSKYQKGANTPIGQTEFQFKAGSLNFHSTVYQWLVVAGAKAQFKGSGTINGTGDYGFLLTATDGQLSGGGGVDKFRIKIVDKSMGTTIYDNVPSGSDDIDTANPQAIEGGSIVIHK